MTLANLVLPVLARWSGLVALAAVLGGLAVELLVLPRGSLELAAVRPRLRCWHVIAVAVLILSTAGELVLRTRTMTAGSVGTAVAAAPVVLAHTHFGSVWMARAGGLALLLALAFARGIGLRGAALLLAGGVALTTSLTGHAGDWGDLSIRVLADWAHVMASGAWAGGLGALGFVVLGRRGDWPPAQAAAVARRFSRLAGYCLPVVAGSGVYNAWVQVHAWPALWGTAYGRVLAVKLLAVLGLVALGAVNRYGLVPRLDPDRTRRGRGISLLRRARLILLGPLRGGRTAAAARLAGNVGREAVLALGVFACTAILGESTPARHAVHAGHAAGAGEELGPFRVTMDELHRGGGVPKGWIFTTPTGDPASGRQVFVRLECFRCHTMQGEGFPAPTAAGPDLTGMGEHHPVGYLVESVMNPNAVIVEGPGYTGPDGRSIMPDYRQSLTVDELIDLVAYLKSR